MGWREAYDEDDPIPQSRTEDSIYPTLVSPSMSSTYPRIDWLTLLAYHPLQDCWKNCDSAPTPSTGSSPPRFWSLIGSRSFIFCTMPELVVTSPPTSARWLAWWRRSCPSPPYMVTSLPGLICSRNFTISSWTRLTSMVLPPLNWKTCSRSNTPPLNRCSLIHSFYDSPGTSPVVVVFTHIVLLILKGLTKYLSSYQVYFSCKIPPMSLHDISNPAPPSSYLQDYYIWFIKNN